MRTQQLRGQECKERDPLDPAEKMKILIAQLWHEHKV
jgi:hypothetical protein